MGSAVFDSAAFDRAGRNKGISERNDPGAAVPPPGHPESRAASTLSAEITRVEGGVAAGVSDDLAIEEPLEIQLSYGPRTARKLKAISVTMRTPGHDQELAAGFLLTEGVIDDASQLAAIDLLVSSTGATTEPSLLPGSTSGNTVRVALAPEVEVRAATFERNFYTTSSCGICGKASLLALRSVCPPRRKNELFVAAETLEALPGRLRAAQEVFAVTGGLHGAALFTAQGALVLSREDVGRHNAVDKLIGNQLLQDLLPLRETILMLSGRVSFELMQKAIMAGIPMVVAVGAPSSLALTVARDFDITLVAFLRDRRFNVYHGFSHVTGLGRNASGSEGVTK